MCRPAPVWRASAQEKITEIAKEALTFSQQLPKTKELKKEEIETVVKKKIIDNKSLFMSSVFKQF